MKNVFGTVITGVIAFVCGFAFKETLVAVTVREANKGANWALKHMENYDKVGKTLESIGS